MAIGNGRGDPAKLRILSRYTLQPVIHTRLLNGKAITCCCGDTVGRQYYKFNAIDKATDAHEELYAGDGCAATFIRLNPAIAPLPLFDPLQGPPRQGHGAAGGPGGNAPPMHPLNAEIHDAIHLILICWGAQPMRGSVFSTLLDEIRQFPQRPLFEWKVKSVNTAISRGQPLNVMLGALRADNPTLRHYQFPLMQQALQRAGVPSYL